MGKYTLPEMPYAYDALEPHIDAQTMEIHHTKHHQKYTDGMNGALEKLSPELQEKAFIANAERNKWVLRKDIKRFEEKFICNLENHGEFPGCWIWTSAKAQAGYGEFSFEGENWRRFFWLNLFSIA